mmetsp:Transcript_59515/g.163250  ORF Transcript_59515/g.163250 Transcript_59515/m.163250 type:complete len:224 (+) Transcript_59515:523-1194(+)
MRRLLGVEWLHAQVAALAQGADLEVPIGVDRRAHAHVVVELREKVKFELVEPRHREVGADVHEAGVHVALVLPHLLRDNDCDQKHRLPRGREHLCARRAPQPLDVDERHDEAAGAEAGELVEVGDALSDVFLRRDLGNLQWHRRRVRVRRQRLPFKLVAAALEREDLSWLELLKRVALAVGCWRRRAAAKALLAAFDEVVHEQADPEAHLEKVGLAHSGSNVE